MNATTERRRKSGKTRPVSTRTYRQLRQGVADAKGKIKDLDTLKATYTAIGKQCSGCHETYRVKLK